MITTNTKLYLREAGSPVQPAIVFLHGSPLSSRMWLPQLECLAEFHCLAPDLPGHGQSAAIPLAMPDLVQRLVQLIQEKAPQGKAHIVGLSFGGVVAQALMVQAPQVVDRVILSGTATRMNKFLVWMSMLNEPVLRMMKPEQVATLVCSQFGIPKQHAQGMSEDFKLFSAKTLSDVMRTYQDIEMPAQTKSPTLVMVGQKETVYAKSAARSLQKGIPRAKGVLAPGGHVWNLEAPELFAKMVAAWATAAPLPQELQPLR